MKEYDEYYQLENEESYRQNMPNMYSKNYLYQQMLEQQNAFPQNIQNTVGLPNFNSNLNNIDKNCGMYNLDEGFIRGNMFPNLFDPYKKQQLKNITASNEKEKMMNDIQALDFAMKDINLYLDIYPNDNCMIQKFNEYLIKKENILNSYESKFGPITLSVPNSSLESDPWGWLETKSPWKGGK